MCLLAHSAYGSPQRGVQLGGGPRPVTYASPQVPSQPNFGPSYSQQLTFGPGDAGTRGVTQGAYRSPQPVLIQQGSPSPAFANFPSPTPFPQGPQRGGPIAALRATPSAANDEEYEEYEDEEEAPKQVPQQRGPIQRNPVRVSQPISFSQGPQRLVVPQSQPQVIMVAFYDNKNSVAYEL